MATTIDTPERQQWLAERRTRLGATDISAIFGINPYRTAYEVWLEKRGLLEDWQGNEATYLGNLLEPGLLDEAENRWGQLERNVVVQAPGLPIASTLDGWLTDDEEPVEIKTAGLVSEFAELGHWGDPGTDEIPEWYLVQAHTQLFCTGSERCRMLALIGGRGIVEYEIQRDQEICDAIVGRAVEWWTDHIKHKIEPPRDCVPAIEILKRIKREPESCEMLGETDLELVDRWEAAKAEAKVAKDTAEELKSQVLLTLGTSEAGLLPDGRMLTYLERSRKGYVVESCKFRVLMTKKGKR